MTAMAYKSEEVSEVKVFETHCTVEEKGVTIDHCCLLVS